MARRSLRARKPAQDEPSDRRSAQKRRNAEAETAGTPRQKKKKSEKDSSSERRGKPGRPSRGKKETPPATPTSTKGRGSGRKGRGPAKKRTDRFQMVLEDDYDKDYIDYESPEEEIQEAEEEDVLDMDTNQEDDETPEEETNIDITSDSDSETEAGHSSRCPSEIDEMSMEPLDIWRDNSRHFPELELPESSLDLLIPPSQLLLDALEAYETLRHFSQALKLTVSKFECFLTALVHKEHNAMISHTFLALLKTLYKSDDRSGIAYGPADSRDGAYSLYAFTDLLTWPYSLKVYAASDPVHFGDLDLDKINNLPFESTAVKVQVLKALLSAVLDSDIIRNFIEKGRTDHTGEETCRSCQTKGQLVLCDRCPAGYHPHCANIKDTDKIDQISFECTVCLQNKINLVHDCIPEAEEEDPKYLRHVILGYDRHGRKYWYLVRRLWVEDSKENKCWYYSTPHQFDELINALDAADYESSLVKKLEEMKQEITGNMEKTITATKNVSLTTAIRQVKPQAYFDFISPSSDGVLAQPTCKFAPGTPTNEEFPEHAKIETTFRLGLERLVYQNFYYENRQAMNKRELKEIKDFEGKLYAMEYAGNWDRQKFVRPENINRILWSSNKVAGIGVMERLIREIVDTMRKLSEGFSKWYFHPDWMQKRMDWRQKLNQCRDIKEIARLLEVFEAHLRPCMKRTIWFDCVGQTSLTRISTKEDQKGSEARKQRDKKLKLEEIKAEEERTAYRETLYNPYVHYNRNKESILTNRMTKLSMVKGEEYRYDRGFCGWYWRSKTYRSTHKKPKSESVSSDSISEKKDLKVDKLLELREHMEEVAEAEKKAKEEAEKKAKEEADIKEEEKKQTEKDMDDILSSVLETAAAESEKLSEKATPRKVENGEEIKQEPEDKPDIKPSEPEEATAQPVKLKKRVITQIPELTSISVKKFTSRGVFSLFRYSYGVKHMARTGGCVPCAKGFNYNAKSHRSNEVWPYPAPKPAYHIIWKYRLAECDDIYTLAHLLSIFIRMLKWDLVVERPPFVDGDKLTWTDTSEDENITYEIKNKRYLAGSARLRMEYEVKQTILPADSEEIIPTRDQRAVEAMARSGRRLRQLKNTDDYSRNEPSETVAWINEERMKIWQIELYHRVTEENGGNASRSATYERGGSLRDRSSIRPREVLDPSPDYTPEKNIPTRARPHSDNSYKEQTMSNSILDSRNKFLPSRPARIIRPPDQISKQDSCL
ncbi:Oidioi.mRNA.OKI2018_I69.chr2.g8245.t4.cds [Oikopleura dioica]|uniref:Oidioi.mRNA.OKI2018_I69.chr2.g8245.t4.cds n=1 Tax=Oikopleura dioica TaxID=34765 RepID=A0ABN7T975_OIKDI|nr:Oidioi.mRNA.OKI2018_I69.chr2.g8245.t4.cds [Oikopleura dioica]